VHCNAWLAEEGYLTYDTDEPESLADLGADTEAFSLIPGRFFVNLEGREANGSVSEGEYKTVRDRLVDDLTALTGPDGDPVCADVYLGEDVFDGPAADIAPDRTAST